MFSLTLDLLSGNDVGWYREHRVLYDSNWVEEGCPHSQYDDRTNVDSSVWTFTSCYATAAMGMTLAALLLALSSTYPAQPYDRLATSSNSLQSQNTEEKGKLVESARKVMPCRETDRRNRNKNKKNEERPMKMRNKETNKILSCPPGNNPEPPVGSHICSSHEKNGDPPIKRCCPLDYEDSSPKSACYLEDGTISTDPNVFDREAPSSEPAVAVLVTNPPPPILRQPDIPPTFPKASSTAEDSDPSSNRFFGDEQCHCHYQQPYNDCYITLLICYFMFLSSSRLVAGFGHMTGQNFQGKVPNRIIHGTAVLSATSLLAIAVSEYLRLLAPTRKNSRNMNSEEEETSQYSYNRNGNRTIFRMVIWMICSLPAVVIFLILDSNLFTGVFLAISHLAIFLTALFRICFSEQRHLILWFMIDAVSMVVYILGFSVQAFLDEPCGYHGYKHDCFADCPFIMSTTTVNHNAVFHLCLLASLLMYGCSKMVQMQPESMIVGYVLSSDDRDSSACGAFSITPIPASNNRRHPSRAVLAVRIHHSSIEV